MTTYNRAQFQAENDHRYTNVAGRFCVYCGGNAVLLDHVPPLYAVFKNTATPWAKVPSCYECNQLLGTFPDISAFNRVLTVLKAIPEIEEFFDWRSRVEKISDTLYDAPSMDVSIWAFAFRSCETQQDFWKSVETIGAIGKLSRRLFADFANGDPDFLTHAKLLGLSEG